MFRAIHRQPKPSLKLRNVWPEHVVLQRQCGHKYFPLLKRRQCPTRIERQVMAGVPYARANLFRPAKGRKKLAQVRILWVRRKILTVDKPVEQRPVGIGNPHLTGRNQQLRSITTGIFAMHDAVGH